jgi:SAM-dependent methyltransferase
MALYELWLPGFLINPRIRDEDWVRRPAQNNRDLDIIESYVSNKNAILDIGCAAGDLLVKARERGWKYQIGQDLSMACIEVAKQVGIEVAYGFTFQMEYNPESIDAIVMRHTLEHTPELRFELSKLRDALTPDGILYIIVPRYGGELWEHSLPQHIHHFTVDTLDLVLDVCDYEILFIEEVETSRALVDDSMKGITNNIRVIAKKKKE